MFEIKLYTPDRADEWNQFVAESKNGTFLFDRRYMDYHSDRFHDHSLMFYDEKGLFAVLPANRVGDRLISHQGLTYGGLIMSQQATAAKVCELFSELNERLRHDGFQSVEYKPVPWIYHRLPSEEDLYALVNICQARLTARELSTTIVLPKNIRWSRIRRRGVKRSQEAGVEISVSDDLAAFWPVLDANLLTNHQVHPVHTLAEMELLKSRFPENIILYTATLHGETLGGVLLYLTTQVVHAQYSSATDEGKRLGVLDALYDRIMHQDMNHYPYFDFGKSTEDRGRFLNEQLIFQKEGFGGRGLCYDTYEWDLIPFTPAAGTP